MNAANARIRWAIASDQFDREMEKLFRANDFRIVEPGNLPNRALAFWDGQMRKMLATGWRKIVR